MTDVKKVLSVVSNTDKAMAKGIGNSQAMLKSSINRLEKRIMGLYNDFTLTKDGNLVGPRVNLKQAQSIHKDLVNLFEEEYGKGARRAVAGYNDVAKLVQNEFKEFDIAATFTKIDRDMIDALKEQAYAEYVQFGTGAQERIAQAMYDTVAAGGSFAELLSTTTGILQGGKDARGRSMAAYATQWANDGVMNYHQSVTLKKAKDASLITFLYYGDIITTSRQFCIDRVGKVYTKQQIDTWNDMPWAGKSGPPLTYRGGYNCRHHWHAIKKEWVPNGEIPIQDIYKEQGIEIGRGSTVPVWPVKKGGAVNTTAGKKKVVTEYKDKYNRWVPATEAEIKSAEGQAWLDNIYKLGEDFADDIGLGPCAPTADNIVDVLQARGVKARTMFTHYLPPEDFGKAMGGFPHYVAVELDEADNVIRIWDPTNPYRVKGKRITKLKPGQKPREYWPNKADSKWRDDTDIFGEKERICGDVETGLYGKEERQWWYGKMDRPKLKAVAQPKPTPPPPPKFTPAKTKKEADKYTERYIRQGNISGGWQLAVDYDGNPAVRFTHSGLKGTWPERQRKTRERYYGKVVDAGKLDLAPTNVLNEYLTEFDHTCDKLGIPSLRGVRITQNEGLAASMGDGVLEINFKHTNRYWDGYTKKELDAMADKLDKVVKTLEDKLAKASTVAPAEGSVDEYKVDFYKRKLLLKTEERDALRKGQVRQLHPAKKYDWDADPIDARPFSSKEYYSWSDERFRSTLWHEGGHHLHQQLYDQYYSPYMETWLDDFKKWVGYGPTKYGDTDAQEWFAENYTLWKMGLKEQIPPKALTLMQGVQDLEDGKITKSEFKQSLAQGLYKYED